ncbi:MAG: LamG domain-containing protein [Kiritimatiellae bacterium]|nr:LamG domain-containing protein [Kiritimatiellia bacterium]
MKHFMCCTITLISVLLAVAPASAQGSGRLIGWWKMDDAPGSSTLVDSSGYGRNAALGSGVSIIDGRFGKAVLFDGSVNAWAQFTNPAHLTNFTLAAWVKVTSFANSYPKLFQLGYCYFQFSTSMPGKFSLGIGSTPTRGEWNSNGTGPFMVETDKWTHAAVVVKRSYTSPTEWVTQPVFYINGVRCGTLQTPKTYSPDAAGSGSGYLGNTGVNGTRAFDGAMDDVRIYDECLTDREILELYQNCPVVVDAGLDQTCHRAIAQLQGRLISTNPYSAAINATSYWSVVSSPIGVLPVFATPFLPATTVTLPEDGVHVLRLTAVSELGTTSNDVTVVRDSTTPSGNSAPVVTLPWSSTSSVLGQGLALTGFVTDDANPSAVPSLRWSKLSGPGGVFFDNAFTNTTVAYFSTNGIYVLQLAADDGAATGADQVTVTVNLPAGDLADGLLHWWQMDEDPALTSSYDSAGANTLTLRNQTLLQPGKIGNGLRFPSTNSYAQATILTNAECFTFSLWLYYDAAYTNNIGKRIFDYGTSRFFIYFNPDKIYLATRNLADTGDYSWTQQNYSLENDKNQWVHLAILYDRRPSVSAGKRQAFYINGISTGSSALGAACDGSKAFTTGDLRIGGNGSIRNFDGVFDEMRIYDRLLSDEEIKTLAIDPDNNHAPVIEAAAALTIQVGHSVDALARVYDDGQPRGLSLATSWSVVSGDAAKVLFDDPGDPATTITITRSGDYLLRLFATDGELSNAVNIHVTAAASGTILMLQ